jgi:hypothetical protein
MLASRSFIGQHEAPTRICLADADHFLLEERAKYRSAAARRRILGGPDMSGGV